MLSWVELSWVAKLNWIFFSCIVDVHVYNVKNVTKVALLDTVLCNKINNGWCLTFMLVVGCILHTTKSLWIKKLGYFLKSFFSPKMLGCVVF